MIYWNFARRLALFACIGALGALGVVGCGGGGSSGAPRTEATAGPVPTTKADLREAQVKSRRLAKLYERSWREYQGTSPPGR